MHLDMAHSRRILDRHDELAQTGRLMPSEIIGEISAGFRTRFGPEVLARLEGDDLLNFMHSRGRKDTLVYWLEFKNDSELPDYFGSIRGGPANKFGLYQEKGTGKWLLRRHRRPVEISYDQAIAEASHQRAQLLAGVEALSTLHPNATEQEYRQVQEALTGLDSWVIDTAWAHKYFTLLFPNLLDNYHSFDWQHFHLVKLWTVPYPGNRRYLNAYPFISISRQLGIHPINLTYTLNELHGRPHRFWAARHIPVSPEWGPQELAPVGLPDDGEDPRYSPKTPPVLRDFLMELNEEDTVFWSDGITFGTSELADASFRYIPGSDAPYRRKVGRAAWTAKWNDYSRIFYGRPFRKLDLSNSRDAAFVVDMERTFTGRDGERTPLHLKEIALEMAGRLQQFHLELAATPQEHLRGLSLSVLVGENGTGKTTLLQALARMWEPDLHAEGDEWVTYTVQGRRSEAGRRSGRVLEPGAMPSRVIVSSYAALDRYDHTSRPSGSVPYHYLGVSQGDEMATAFLAILRALFKQDRTLLSLRERKKLEAIDRLLQMVDYGKNPLVKFLSAPVVRGAKVPLTPALLAGPLKKLGYNLGLDDLQDDHAEVLHRLLEFVAATPGLVGPEELRNYPGSIVGWLEDLAIATQLKVRIIDDLYFQRRQSLVPLLWLSSGEQSLLYRFFRLLDEIRDNAIVIIDEPETHLHPRWIMRFVELLQIAFQDYSCHFLLATHSPLLAADLPRECIVSLEIDPETDRVISRSMDEETLGSNPRQILHQVFGIADTVGPLTRSHIRSVEKAITDGDRELALDLLDRMGESILKFDLFRRIDQMRPKPEGQH